MTGAKHKDVNCAFLVRCMNKIILNKHSQQQQSNSQDAINQWTRDGIFKGTGENSGGGGGRNRNRNPAAPATVDDGISTSRRSKQETR